MTTLASPVRPTASQPGPPPKPVRKDRRGWGIGVAIILALSALSAGLDPTELVNTRGWSQVQAFFGAMFRPDLSGDMVRLTIRESAVTVGFALVGTAVALIIGSIGGILLTERLWSPLHGKMRIGRYGWFAGRLIFAIPRSMHEVVFGLILVNILGLNPLVAILAIGIPFGAVTAKVFAETLDEVPIEAEVALRAAGAGRLTALLIATVPGALGDLVSYAFYRFECSLRSAAVLGIVGAGGLGFQLALSFQSLRYEQMWTILWALVILSGIADRWSSAVRRSERSLTNEQRSRFMQASLALCTIGVLFSIWRLEIDVTTLWAPRARMLAVQLVEDSWPPQIGAGGAVELFTDSLDTIALAVLSIALAVVAAAPLAVLARRPPPDAVHQLGRKAVSLLTRFVMLISRAVPPPVWAFIVVFVLFPGLWPGAVALGIYNAGILGRLQAEVIENSDDRPARVLAASGATGVSTLLVSTMPTVASRFVGLSLYRWEVAIRETVIVGVVGAAGLGRRLDEQTSSFNFDGVLATILALFVVTIAVDVVSGLMRRSLR